MNHSAKSFGGIKKFDYCGPQSHPRFCVPTIGAVCGNCYKKLWRSKAVNLRNFVRMFMTCTWKWVYRGASVRSMLNFLCGSCSLLLGLQVCLKNRSISTNRSLGIVLAICLRRPGNCCFTRCRNLRKSLRLGRSSQPIDVILVPLRRWRPGLRFLWRRLSDQMAQSSGRWLAVSVGLAIHTAIFFLGYFLKPCNYVPLPCKFATVLYPILHVSISRLDCVKWLSKLASSI